MGHLMQVEQPKQTKGIFKLKCPDVSIGGAAPIGGE